MRVIEVVNVIKANNNGTKRLLIEPTKFINGNLRPGNFLSIDCENNEDINKNMSVMNLEVLSLTTFNNMISIEV